jgi:ATP-dependent Clp endopeptidase proteolytic subunit ClpP
MNFALMSKSFTVYAFGEVGKQVTLNYFVNQLNSVQKGNEVNVIINSPGGDVSEGYAIYDYLTDLKGKGVVVNTEILGMCASIATVFFLAGENRVMHANSEFMIHNPWGKPEGDAKVVRKYADELEKIENRLIEFYSTKTHSQAKAIEKMMDAETYLSPDEAKNLGFITEIKTELKAVAKIKIEKSNKMSKQTKGVIAQIKSLFKALEDDAPVALSLTLADGTIAEVETENETASVGDAVTVDGEPAPDGTHELADGTSIVTVDGVITEIMAMEEDEEDYEAMKAEIAALKAERDEAVNGLAEVQAMLEKKAKTVSKPFNMKRETFKQKEAVKTVFSKDTLKQINSKKK